MRKTVAFTLHNVLRVYNENYQLLNNTVFIRWYYLINCVVTSFLFILLSNVMTVNV